MLVYYVCLIFILIYILLYLIGPVFKAAFYSTGLSSLLLFDIWIILH